MDDDNKASSDTKISGELSRRDLLRGGAALLGASVIGSGVKTALAHENSLTSIDETSTVQAGFSNVSIESTAPAQTNRTSFASITSEEPQRPSTGPRPNILYFLVDNLGYGELG